ncbi:MAG: hypothetical protein NT085_02270 [candidate division SR1 bacterium]|nr:hypothetical protein [candidate division SR1 bacterium]
MKIKYILIPMCIVFISLMYGLSTMINWVTTMEISRKKQEIDMLYQVKEAVLDKYIPDSLKEASRDASHNLMYAEPDGNDYWASRHTIHETEAYIKECRPCMYIDSLLKAKEKELQQLEH